MKESFYAVATIVQLGIILLWIAAKTYDYEKQRKEIRKNKTSEQSNAFLVEIDRRCQHREIGMGIDTSNITFVEGSPANPKHNAHLQEKRTQGWELVTTIAKPGNGGAQIDGVWYYWKDIRPTNTDDYGSISQIRK